MQHRLAPALQVNQVKQIEVRRDVLAIRLESHIPFDPLLRERIMRTKNTARAATAGDFDLRRAEWTARLFFTRLQLWKEIANVREQGKFHYYNVILSKAKDL